MTTSTIEQPQHLAALQRANEVRSSGVELRREIEAGELSIARALLDPRAGSLPIGRLLEAQRGWGEHKASRTLGRLRIPHSRRVSALTDRQRLEVARVIEARRRRGLR